MKKAGGIPITSERRLKILNVHTMLSLLVSTLVMIAMMVALMSLPSFIILFVVPSLVLNHWMDW